MSEEELKNYIAELVNTVAKAMVKAFESVKIEDVNMFQLGYNKAIDDFIKGLDNICGYYNQENKVLTRDMVLKVAEQLKAGGEDAGSI